MNDKDKQHQHHNNLKVELKSKKDRNGKIYYVGNIEFPGVIDCSDGVTFFIYTSEQDAEELQIAKTRKDNFRRPSQEFSREDDDNGNYR